MIDGRNGKDQIGMTQQETSIGQKDVLLYGDDHPQALLLQTVGLHERETVEYGAKLIAELTHAPFLMAAVDVSGWENEHVAWNKVEVTRQMAVGKWTAEALSYILDTLLPELHHQYGQLPAIIGGYSLGGLFSLWTASLTDRFTAVAAASPSLWVRGWTAFAEANPVHAQFAYLSLGDQEEHTKNATFARIGDCVRHEHELLLRQLGPDHTTLVWEQGNHFTETDARLSRAFAWCIEKINPKII